MADLLYLSYWLRGFGEANMLRHFEKALRVFPLSALAPGISTLRFYAFEYAEPPMFERFFDRPPALETVLTAAREFRNADCAYLAGGYWDLWQFENSWKLAPAPVTLGCYGPLYQNDHGDQLRLELGPDLHFLPQPEYPASVDKIRSNIQGILRLARDLDGVLPVEKRQLWSESGESFAGRFEEALGGSGLTLPG